MSINNEVSYGPFPTDANVVARKEIFEHMARFSIFFEILYNLSLIYKIDS